MGLEGAKFLTNVLPEMKILSKLNLSDNDIGDAGMNELIVGIKTYCSLEYLDISGNNLGKTPASLDLAESLNLYLSNNRNLEVLKLNWNSLRGSVADKIIDGLIFCYGIREVHMNNNLIGGSYEDKQPPVNRMAELIQQSKNLEYLDISFNCID